MKKTKVRKLSLHRETLRQLVNMDLAIARGGDSGENWCSVPSCIDGCPSAICPTTIIKPDGRG